MSHIAATPTQVHTAPELADDLHLPLPTVSKLLRRLVRGRVLVSQRGVKGGYTMARAPEDLTLATIISALEGPISLTLCTVDTRHDCKHEAACRVKGHWQRINRAVREALDAIPLSEMALPVSARFMMPAVTVHSEQQP